MTSSKTLRTNSSKKFRENTPNGAIPDIKRCGNEYKKSPPIICKP
jgi:hypothetical protein